VPQVPALPGTPIDRSGRSDRSDRSDRLQGAERSDALSLATAAFFAPGGPLARVVGGYEPRHGQQQMALAVADVLTSGGTLLAEAGTGTGKTLAYLIPALLNGQRVLVSTGTKNLQEQIFFKDLPALQQAMPAPFTVTMMKGRSNYLCLHRFELYRDGVTGNTSVPRHGHASMPRLIESGDRVLLPVIDQWSKTTTTGDRAELRDVPEDLPFWKDIAADAETCLGSDCPRYGDCFVTLMRQRAAESDVVIVNHHLLCADAAVRHGNYGEVIPSSPTLVIDEAHQLEDVATQYFGLSFSNFRVDDLLRDGARLLTTRPFGERSNEIDWMLGRIGECARTFFSSITLARAGRGGTTESRARYDAEAIADHFENGMTLAGALEELETALALVNRRGVAGEQAAVEPAPGNEAASALQRRAGELRHDLRQLMRADDRDYVYFLETRGRGVFLRAAPIDVSRLVQDAVLDRFRSVVLTSATLAVDASFDYVKGRLGIKESAELRVASEFDYARQALLYLPRRMPPPKAPGFAEAAARETIEILRRSRGRAFVLFTSYAVLRIVQQFVEMALPYPILVQGSAPRSVLIEEFRTTPNAVLLATSSFWQGVDVVGDALSCVIIDKLPFASPGDPVTAARIDALKADGGDAFSDYQVPLAILNLQQGLGRLIRHRSDRGVLAILDPRLKTMGYGRRFLASLPPAPVTHDIDAIGRFFA
jgi:ATP-dependent DNA helicase DinG